MGKPEEARICAVQLNFRVRKVQTGDELWVELEKAVWSKLPSIRPCAAQTLRNISFDNAQIAALPHGSMWAN